jgi:glycerol uptake facilitator-like aquaporin
LANLMFNLSGFSISMHHRVNHGALLAEVVATAGLVVVIFGAVRGDRVDRVAYAVGAYITAAYWFTSSTSFANPAVTVARMFSNTFAGIAPASVGPFVLAQVVGGAVALGLLAVLHPVRGERRGFESHNQSVEFP